MLGLERTTSIAREAAADGRGAVELVREKGLLSREQIDAVLAPSA